MYITQQDFLARANELLKKVILHDDNEIKIYGVPRAGKLVVYYLLGACLQKNKIIVVDNVKDADIIIDDILDSGKTKQFYFEKYPDKPFYVLVDKQAENIPSWVQFPWQEKKEFSADSIPTRLLQYIGEDINRQGLIETPKRFLKAWADYTSGYEQNPNDVLKTFEDGAENYNELVLLKNIPVFSHCEHHLAPFYGVAHIAYIPDGKIVGLSKLPRLLNIFMRRLQVQERLTMQVATTLMKKLSPLGVAVVLECSHTCMIARGIQVAGSTTVTSSMHGVFKTSQSTRSEFLQLIK